MKYHVKARIVELTEWMRDEQMIDGDMSHASKSAILMRLAKQVKDRLEDFTFKPEGLPFEREFDIESDCEVWLTEEEVKDYILNWYIDTFMPYDYVKPCDCELEIISKEEKGE